jgi:hypothetical protein
MFGILYSRTSQPVDNAAQYLLVTNPCIIETRGVNKDYATRTTGNGNRFDRCGARLQVVANGHSSMPSSSVYELSLFVSLWNHRVEI